MSSLLSRWLPRKAEATAVSAPADTLSPMSITPAGLVGEFLAEEQIDTPKLLSLFKQAFLDVEVAGDTRLRVRAENGTRVSVAVDTKRQLIQFVVAYGLREDAPMIDKLALCNRVNDQVIFVRFSVSDPTTLVSDYSLPFDGGVTAAAIMATLRRMARITGQSIGEMDEDKLVV